MQNNKILKKLFIAMLFCSAYSCSDNLDIEPNDQIARENFFQSEQDFRLQPRHCITGYGFPLMTSSILGWEMEDLIIYSRHFQIIFTHSAI